MFVSVFYFCITNYGIFSNLHIYYSSSHRSEVQAQFNWFSAQGLTGLQSSRLPSWAPFCAQILFQGHVLFPTLGPFLLTISQGSLAAPGAPTGPRYSAVPPPVLSLLSIYFFKAGRGLTPSHLLKQNSVATP